LLVVEVADRSLRHDRDVKIPLYARHAIPECWLIDVRGKRLSRYRSSGANGYSDIDEPDPSARMPVPGVEGASVTLATLFAY
jgi:Uma2 family endonuclease